MTIREKLDVIRNELGGRPEFDPEMWKMLDLTTLKLRNVHGDKLVQRYRDIVTTLLWLRRPSMDNEPISQSHFSTVWWLRMLAQTEAELERRKITDIDVSEGASQERLIPDCEPEMETDFKTWARVSTMDRLLETLTAGEIWFSPAEGFDDPKLNAAQRDDELRRQRSTPGQTLKIVGSKGRSMIPIGDVTYTRQADAYWLSSWSTGPDLRLIDEFQVDACLVVWNPSEFDERINAAVERDLPGWFYASFPIQYVDEYDMVNTERMSVSMTKEFRFARQRELRLGLLASSGAVKPAGGFLVKAGSIEDIASVYDRRGDKVAGSGPDCIRRS
ncbi:hypothetical protein AAIH70_05575 [Neorhizobium sp. BT27B]|uniref:hypothetical protein n=1 Tax=Neorhizobium sp. BT27B TaxID=3142625 RepID=UPI003D2AB124